MEMLYTSTGPRPELSDIAINPPEGYIGGKILPTVKVGQKAGKLYYQALVADVSAQTGRSTGVAPTGTQIAGTSVDFTAAERIKRGMIAPDEVATYGGIDKADMIGTKFAMRSVYKSRETEIATAIIGGTPDYTFDGAKIKLQVQVAKDAIRRYYGKLSLVCSTQTFNGIILGLLESKIAPAFTNLVNGGNPTAGVMGLTDEAYRSALAMYLGLSQVLLGDDDVWNAGSNAGRFAIARLDDGTDDLVHKYEPVYGRTLLFLPQDAKEFFVESYADRDAKNNKYDATAWDDVLVLNSGASKLFSGVPVT